MTKIAIVTKNADFTEGRGPMIFHRAYDSYDASVAYIQTQRGIYGSEQYKTATAMNLDNSHFNGYAVEMVELLSGPTMKELLELMTDEQLRVELNELIAAHSPNEALEPVMIEMTKRMKVK